MSFSFHPIPYTHTHTIHFATQSLSHIIHLFFISSFIFQTFLLTTIYKKTKTKTSSSPYYGYTFSNISLPSLSLYLPHYSLLHHYTSFIIFRNLTLLPPILLVHAYGYTSSNLSLPSLPLYLPHYSLLYYISFIIFYFLFYNFTLLNCINLISFLPFNPYFYHTKTMSTLSLLVNFCSFL